MSRGSETPPSALDWLWKVIDLGDWAGVSMGDPLVFPGGGDIFPAPSLPTPSSALGMLCLALGQATGTGYPLGPTSKTGCESDPSSRIEYAGGRRRSGAWHTSLGSPRLTW